MTEAMDQEAQAVFHVTYLICIKAVSLLIAFCKMRFIFLSWLNKCMFLSFRHTPDKPAPLKNHSPCPLPTLPSVPSKR